MESSIFKNYSEKIRGKLNIFPDSIAINPEEFNSLIVLLNYCFTEKNNFYIDSFNKRNIKLICNIYNQIKTNIFNIEEKDVFNLCDIKSLKMLKFILIQFLSKYDNIKQTDIELCENVSISSIKICHQYLTVYMTNYQKIID